jgi:hypothetical protein
VAITRAAKAGFTSLALLMCLFSPATAQAVPAGFFGIAPQTQLTVTDAEYMRAGGIESIRVPVPWSGVQPSADGGYKWEGIDATVAVAARARLRVLPFLYATPHWLAHKYTTLPVANAKQRDAWSAFVQAAVERYGPRGQFWIEHNLNSAEPVPKYPIRSWQIWNEANFFYFAFPVSVSRYAKLLELAHAAIERVDPGAKTILSGLFGRPDQRGSRGMPAAEFLDALYRTPRIESHFDGVALHPYAVDAEMLKGMVEEVSRVTALHRDRVPLYITELGWGSENNYRQVAFEQGTAGQIRQMRRAYRYLMSNRRLRVRGAYWFSWKDLEGSCSFCDSVGLFREGTGFHPKPAWHAFIGLTGGSARP